MLLAYGLVMCDEWVRRGHTDTVRAKLAVHLRSEGAMTGIIRPALRFGRKDLPAELQ